MKAHELARQLLGCGDYEVTASIDITVDENDDSGRRIFTRDCFGVNDDGYRTHEIVILFSADPKDNYDKPL